MKEEAEKVDKFEKECKLEVSQKEKQVCSVLPSNMYSFFVINGAVQEPSVSGY